MDLFPVPDLMAEMDFQREDPSIPGLTWTDITPMPLSMNNYQVHTGSVALSAFSHEATFPYNHSANFTSHASIAPHTSLDGGSSLDDTQIPFTVAPLLQQVVTTSQTLAELPFATRSTTDMISNATETSTGPTKQEWESVKDTIKRLYVDEGKKLKDVMAVLAHQGHIATERMFKRRLQNWGYDKKLKESEILAIIRKKGARDAIGKKTAVRVHGRIVDDERIETYLKRKKKYRSVGTNDAPTPPHISCSTPSPVLESASLHYGSQTLPGHQNTNSAMVRTTRQWLDSKIRNPDMSRSPTPPSTLKLPEELMYNIRVYCESQFENKIWVTGKDGWCKNIVSTTTNGDAHTDFYAYCELAVEAYDSNSPQTLRRMLSKARSTISGILQGEAPQALDRIFDTLIYLAQNGLEQAALILCNAISVESRFLPRKNHPWTRICHLLGRMEADNMVELLIQLWKCSLHFFQETLGKLNTTALWNYLGLISREFRATNPIEEERILRELLVDYEQSAHATIADICAILGGLGDNKLQQGNYEGSEEIGMDILARIGDTERLLEPRIGALQLLAYSHYCQNIKGTAEGYLLDAMKLRAFMYGDDDADVINLKGTLSTWYRGWGRVEEADKLRAEIDEAIGEDDIDREQREQAMRMIG